MAPPASPSTVDGLIFKTAFLGFPWEVIADGDARVELMQGLLEWLAGKPDTGQVAGTVTDFNDEGPIAGAVVTAMQGGEPVRATTTDAGGNYRLRLGLGDYTLKVSAAHYGAETVDVSLVTDGQEVPVDLP